MTILEMQAKIKEIAKERRNWRIEAEEKKRGFLEYNKKSNYDNYLMAAGVPKKFLNVQSKAESRSLFITGSFKTGKTHHAISIMKSYIDSLPPVCFVEPFGKLPIFITAPDLLLKIRSVFSLKKCEDEIVDKYSSTPLLILDDLGVEKTTEFSLQTLYIIFNRRCNERLQTIITSKLTLDEVENKLGDHIASRIAGMCHIVKIAGKNRRLEKNGGAN